MRVFVQPSPRQLGVEYAQAVRRRLLLALATVAPAVATVAVRLLPAEKAPHSLAGCRLVLRLVSGQELSIERFDADPLEAVGHSAAQADRWVRRQLFAAPLALANRR
jgi:hypothetical protein